MFVKSSSMQKSWIFTIMVAKAEVILKDTQLDAA